MYEVSRTEPLVLSVIQNYLYCLNYYYFILDVYHRFKFLLKRSTESVFVSYRENWVL